MIAMRGTSILYVIPLAFLLRRRVRAAHGWLAVAALLAVVAPFSVHNWRAGSRALLTTNLGWNLFIGNGPQADGRFAYPNGWEAERDVTGRRFASRVAGRALTPDETNAFWTTRAVEGMRANPGRVAWLAMRKARLFVRADEIPQNESFRFFQMNVAPVRAAGVGWWLVLPFAVVGLAAGRRAASPLRWAALGFALVPLVTCVAFFVTSRYRLPAVPFLIVLAAGGITGVLDVGRSAVSRFVSLVLALVGSAVLLLLPASYNVSRAISQEYGHVGLRYHAEGALRVAEEHYRKAIEIDPENGDAYNNLGAALAASGRDEDAAQMYEMAIESQPQNPIPYMNLAMVRGKHGDDAAAERHLRRAAELDPRNVQILADLGTALARQGQLREAVEVFERALSLEPSNEGVRGKLIMAREMADALGDEVAP
jgi:thioredoxin-like negative regulator of GroEL